MMPPVESGYPLRLEREEGGVNMPLYMTQFAYTPEAWAALVDNPEDRSAPVREVVESMGG
jgi:hypothetical protein